MTDEALRVALLTREFPPEVYGGAGVHVEYLARELQQRIAATVHCFGKPRNDPIVAGTYEPWSELAGEAPHLAALRTLSVDLAMARGVEGARLVHSHTWYANLAGHFAKLLYGIPHIMTTHSLEPLRPWKAEQLGGGYALSSFCERTAMESADAVIAVSSAMCKDIRACYPAVDEARIVVIPNGIDPEQYKPRQRTDIDAFARFGIDESRPYVIFLGRITRQKGITHLLDAAQHLEKDVQLVLCAGDPDTPEIASEVRDAVAALEHERGGVVWIDKMLPRADVVPLLGAARVFVCPSVYEPFGIVNLEAMACGVPVVASAVGGIPDIVVDGETGYVVPFETSGDAFGTPRDAEGFARDLASRINTLVNDPELASRMGHAGRERVVRLFSWSAIAERTVALYRKLIS